MDCLGVWDRHWLVAPRSAAHYSLPDPPPIRTCPPDSCPLVDPSRRKDLYACRELHSRLAMIGMRLERAKRKTGEKIEGAASPGGFSMVQSSAMGASVVHATADHLEWCVGVEGGC